MIFTLFYIYFWIISVLLVGLGLSFLGRGLLNRMISINYLYFSNRRTSSSCSFINSFSVIYSYLLASVKSPIGMSWSEYFSPSLLWKSNEDAARPTCY